MKFLMDPFGVRQIGVCPVFGTWNKTCGQILDQYQMDRDHHRVHSLEMDHCTVSKDNWETMRWEEDDVFWVKVQSRGDGDVIIDICMGLERYYEFIGMEYPHLMFSEFCEENGYDEESVLDELEMDIEGNALLDLFEGDDGTMNIPMESHKQGLSDNEKKKFMLKLLIKLHENPNMKFSSKVPEFPVNFGEVFTLTDTDLMRMRNYYKQTIPSMWNTTRLGQNPEVHTILAIGYKHKIPYMQLLVDDYNRMRVKNHLLNHKFTVAAWANQSAHLAKLRNYKIRGSSHSSAADVARRAVETWNIHVFPKLCAGFLPACRQVQCDLKSTARYFESAFNFVSKRMKKALPFQFDVSIVAEGAPERVLLGDDSSDDESDDDSDDDSDDEGDDEYHVGTSEMGHDYVDDIEQRLKDHKLPYRVLKDQESDSKSDGNVFDGLYDEFGGKLVIPQKRIISFVDCRKEKDDIYMFEAPKNCRDIPANARDEWYLNSSRTCLLPGNDNYDAGEEVLCNYYRSDDTKRTIGSSSHAAGRVLTFSFHVISPDIVRIYLHWSNQTIRFFPGDLKAVLPRFYDMSFGGNAMFKDSPAMDECIGRMKGKLKDVMLSSFQENVW